MSRRLTRTTLTLPADLLTRVDRAVREGRATSRSAFFAEVLRRQFAAEERAAIDAAFEGMAEDPEHQAEAHGLMVEFAAADAEAAKTARTEAFAASHGP